MTSRVAMETLRQLVADMAGRKLPGERELSKTLHISRQHLRILLDALESEGVVERRQGSGTYAADLRERDVAHVGLLIDSSLKLGNDPFFSLLTERLQLCLQTAGIHCVIERTDGTTHPRFRGDGFITLGHSGLSALSHLHPNDPPAVSLFAEERQHPLPSLGHVSLLLSDDVGAGILAAQRAIAEGFRHLVFFGRPHIPASRQRWEGIQEVVAEANAEADAEADGETIITELVDCAMNYASGRSVAKQVTERFAGVATRRMALIPANDWLAVGLRSGLTEQRSVLNECPCYSFDGLPITDDPALRIHSLRLPIGLIVEDTVAEIRRLSRYKIGRVIQYAFEWVDDNRNPA